MPKFPLRDYQENAVTVAGNFIKYRDGHGYIVAPGGSGKSVMIAALAERLRVSGRVAVIARSEKLVTQNFDKLSPEESLFAGIYCAGLGTRDASRPVTVGTMQSMAELSVDGLKFALVDECDEINAGNEESQYAQFFARHPGLRIVGFTATPFRTKTGKITWGEELVAIPLKPLMDAGYLMPPINKVGDAGKLDLSAVRVTLGEYVQSQLEELFVEPSLLEHSIEKVLQYAGMGPRRSVLVYCQSVAHGELVARALRDSGHNAIMVDGGTDKKVLGDIFADFERGDIRFLVSCNMLTVGIDLPCVDMIAILRATKSKRLFEQMVYRGTRPHPEGGKRDFLLLDMGGNLMEHGPLGSPHRGVGERNGSGGYKGKICPTCEEYVSGGTGAKECGACGYQFPEAETRQVDHNVRADTTSDAVWSGQEEPETFEVTDVTYHHHKGKNGKPDSIKISYWCNYGQYGNISEWISPFSTSDWARGKALEFYRLRGNDLMPPINGYSMDDLLWHAEQLKKPWGIIVDFSEKYPRVKKYIWERPKELDAEYEAPSLEELLDDSIPY